MVYSLWMIIIRFKILHGSQNVIPEKFTLKINNIASIFIHYGN